MLDVCTLARFEGSWSAVTSLDEDSAVNDVESIVTKACVCVKCRGLVTVVSSSDIVVTGCYNVVRGDDS